MAASGGSQGRHGHKVQIGLSTQLACQPKEGLLKVVVALGTDVVVLQVLLAVECNVLGLHLAVLDVNLPTINKNEQFHQKTIDSWSMTQSYLVSAEHNGNILAYTHKIAMPRGHVLVCYTGGHVEHDDGALNNHNEKYMRVSE